MSGTDAQNPPKSESEGMGEQCLLPPQGWVCTRRPGHRGPCAALPESDPRLVVRRLIVRLGSDAVKYYEEPGYMPEGYMEGIEDEHVALIRRQRTEAVREFGLHIKDCHPNIGGMHSGCEMCEFIDAELRATGGGDKD